MWATARKSTQRSVHSKSPKKGKAVRAKHRRARGQQKIESVRVREIQSALIRERYLQGEPSGDWDARTKAAMQRYQSENGWQTKRLPDARALIKLGLGPDHANLINPETASIGLPETSKNGGGPHQEQH